MAFTDKLWDGKGMDYSRAFAMTFIKVFAIISGILFGISAILYIIYFVISRKNRSNTNIKIEDISKIQEESLISKNSTEQCTFLKIKQLIVQMKTPVVLKIIEIIGLILFWVAIILLSLIFPLLSGFGMISTTLSILMSILLYFIALSYQLFRCTFYYPKQSSLILSIKFTFLKLKWVFLIASIYFLACSITVPLIAKKSCLCLYTEAYGVKLPLDTYLSTEYTRGAWIKNDPCPANKVCHVYATLPSNTAQAVFISIQTGSNIKEIQLKFSEEQSQKELLGKCEAIPFPSQIEKKGQRSLFQCLMTQLSSSTLYKLEVFQKEEVIFSSSYRTLPLVTDAFQKKTRILFGGDFGYEKKGIQLASTISQFDPDVILIGGDIAYDNGNIHCYYSYDTFLWIFEKEFQDLGRIIPFIFSIGNHDIGFNSLADYNITVSSEKGPLYFTYFPQRFNDESTQSGIPPIEHRQTY